MFDAYCFLVKTVLFLCKEDRSLKLTRLYLSVFLYSILCYSLTVREI